MKFRNKKTGEIAEWDFGNWYQHILNPDNKESYACTLSDFIDRAAKFHEEWEGEDCIDGPCIIDMSEDDCICDVKFGVELEDIERAKECGLYFETKEEAEQVVEKLKAGKRLKDKGFKTEGWTIDDGLRVSICTNLNSDGIYDEDMKETKKDLDICFGGEE